jgi:type I restriction enzyme M protein
MVGAIIGDIAGSRIEKNFLAQKGVWLTGKVAILGNGYPTDDTMMTLAVAEAVLEAKQYPKEQVYAKAKELAAKQMRKWGDLYPDDKKLMECYGDNFRKWLKGESDARTDSFANGGAMRVSPVAWAADSLEDAEKLARAVTEPTHNHKEGLLGAQVVADIVYLARIGKRKDTIKKEIGAQKPYSGKIKELNEMREKHNASAILDKSKSGEALPRVPIIGFADDYICLKKGAFACASRTVMLAQQAFFESNGFEDAIRRAILLASAEPFSGDSDTIAAMAGAMAEAYYGVPEELRTRVREGGYLNAEQLDVIDRFEKAYPVEIKKIKR